MSTVVVGFLQFPHVAPFCEPDANNAGKPLHPERETSGHRKRPRNLSKMNRSQLSHFYVKLFCKGQWFPGLWLDVLVICCVPCVMLDAQCRRL